MRDARRNRLGVAGVLAGVCAIGFAIAPAFACSGISTLQVTPVLAVPGSELSVVAEGVGTQAGEAAKPVELWWVGEGGKGRQLLATATPNAEGRLDTTVKAPVGAAVGPYLIKLRELGGAEDRQANALVKVVDSPLPSTGLLSRAGDGDTRPLTTGGGFDPAGSSSGASLLLLVPLGALGLALVGAGGLVLARQVRQS